MKNLFASLALVILVAPVWAATRTVTLLVPGMTCPVCPITVKQALSRVVGVNHTIVNFDQREAIVSFDDTKTDVRKLTQATAEAGYPASVKK